jgi:hypothetical protein
MQFEPDGKQNVISSVDVNKMDKVYVTAQNTTGSYTRTLNLFWVSLLF